MGSCFINGGKSIVIRLIPLFWRSVCTRSAFSSRFVSPKKYIRCLAFSFRTDDSWGCGVEGEAQGEEDGGGEGRKRRMVLVGHKVAIYKRLGEGRGRERGGLFKSIRKQSVS